MPKASIAEYHHDYPEPSADLILSGSANFSSFLSQQRRSCAVKTNGAGFTKLHDFAHGAYDSSGYYTNSDGARPIASFLAAFAPFA